MLQAATCLCEGIWKVRETDRWAGREVEKVREPVLVDPKGGYKDDLRPIAPHIAQDLREQGDGWEDVVEFGGPEQEKGVALGS